MWPREDPTAKLVARQCEAEETRAPGNHLDIPSQNATSLQSSPWACGRAKVRVLTWAQSRTCKCPVSPGELVSGHARLPHVLGGRVGAPRRVCGRAPRPHAVS